MLFVRGSTLWSYVGEVSTMLGTNASCLPDSACAATRTRSLSRAARYSTLGAAKRNVIARLNATHARLRQLHA